MPKDSAIKPVMQNLYTHYVNLVSNPFFVVDGEIKGVACKKFLTAIDSLKL